MPVKRVYINLDRDQDRRRHVETQLDRLGSSESYERFPAIDGRQARQRPEVVNRGEVGCFLSHLEVIRRSVGFDGWLHVLEDDAVVSQYARVAIEALMTKAEFEVYDIIFTNILFPLDSWVVSPFRAMFDRSVTTGPSGEVAAIHAIGVVALDNIDFALSTSYLVRPRAIARTADLLARRLEADPFAPIDVAFRDLARSKALSMACSVPFLTAPRLDSGSTIRGGAATAWRVSRLIMENALYADRDVIELRRLLETLGRSSEDSLTRDLIADAYRYSISVDASTPVSI